MNLNIDNDFLQSRKLVLMPRLKQVFEILKMDCRELYRYAEEQMQSNPVLEIDHIGAEEYIEEEMDDGETTTVYKDAQMPSLKDYLLLQLHMSGLNLKEILVGEYLISNIDENGYLILDISEAAAYFNMPYQKIDKVLRIIQSFDPPGIGARNLKECLIIQMRQIKGVSSDTFRIVENYLEDLALGKISKIAEKIRISREKVLEAADFIKKLEPKPGREFFSSARTKYTTCDVIIRKIKNRFLVLINEDAYPILSINAHYRRILETKISKEDEKYIRDSIDNAVWLIKCIEYRKNILRNISEYLIDKQAEFFEKGRIYRKPLSLEMMASEMNIYRSFAESVILDKYLECKWGIFKIADFFRQ